jgi:hypothetical protein
MSALETLPSRADLDHENMLDRLLIADMRHEAAVEVVGSAARRVFRWTNLFGAIGLPLICGAGVALIHMRWPI